MSAPVLSWRTTTPTRRGSSRRSTQPNTTLVQIVLNPLEPWKTTLKTLATARSLGMEVVVALDSRSTPGSLEAVREVAHTVIPFDNTTCWPEGALNEVLGAGHRDWAFLVSDDEEPSPQLWEFAVKGAPFDNDGQPYIWRPRMLAPLPDWSGLYKPLDTYQPRFFPREGLRHPGGFDQMPVSPFKEIDFGIPLWHYTLWSPRSYREQKVRDHEKAWNDAWSLHPWPFPGRKSYLWEDHKDEVVPVGKWEEYRPK